MRINGIKKYIWGGLLLTVLVILYNCWSYMCGKTTPSMLINMGPTAIALIFCNVLAASTLIIIKTTRAEGREMMNCSCGQEVGYAGWKYCPRCGKQISL